jgi:hypothetical protein
MASVGEIHVEIDIRLPESGGHSTANFGYYVITANFA